MNLEVESNHTSSVKRLAVERVSVTACQGSAVRPSTASRQRTHAIPGGEQVDVQCGILERMDD